jgi:uncharacterized membrane protein YphA (DoxX/SURF4 family)
LIPSLKGYYLNLEKDDAFLLKNQPDAYALYRTGGPVPSDLLLLARLLLGAVWAVAGTAKLADREESREAVVRFDLLPDRGARFAGTLLPYLELMLGLSLLSGFGTGAAASGSALLLLVFTAAILANLARGRKVQCHCFGQLGRSTLGPGAVLRNLLLFSLAVLLATTSPPSDLPPILYLPAILLLLGVFASTALLSTFGRTMRFMVLAEDGPQLGSWSYRFLRSRMKLDDPHSPTEG